MEITIEVVIDSSIETVWQCWINPAHITQWYAASDDWHAPRARVDLTPGGSFLIRMEARDESFGFDFEGKFSSIIERQLIEYVLDDGRKVSTVFEPFGDSVKVTQTFDAENENSIEAQQQGWLAILKNFTRYVESQSRSDMQKS